MKLLINTSNLYVGGGLQVALSFINELKNIESNNEYYIFLSKAASKQLDKKEFLKNFNFYEIEESPSSFKNRKRITNYLSYLENEINPEIVFSIFGPTFWTPKTTHVMGFALPWLINPESTAFSELKLQKRIKKYLENLYKVYHVRKNSDYYITETGDTKNRLAKIHNINQNKIYVVGNTYNSHFNNFNYNDLDLPKKSLNEFRMITISHNYPHKNLKIIKEIIPYLEKEDIKYRFILTLDKNSYKDLFSGLEEYVYNLGPIPSNLCPSAYRESDALFLPTLLECFTASYPEAMKMEKPILTSNLSFAHSICENAALYFEPLNPKDIANKIIKLGKNNQLQNDLIQKGKERLKIFETAKSRAEKYLNICEEIIKKEIKNETTNTKF